MEVLRGAHLVREEYASGELVNAYTLVCNGRALVIDAGVTSKQVLGYPQRLGDRVRLPLKCSSPSIYFRLLHLGAQHI